MEFSPTLAALMWRRQGYQCAKASRWVRTETGAPLWAMPFIPSAGLYTMPNGLLLVASDWCPKHSYACKWKPCLQI